MYLLQRGQTRITTLCGCHGDVDPKAMMPESGGAFGLGGGGVMKAWVRYIGGGEDDCHEGENEEKISK